MLVEMASGSLPKKLDYPVNSVAGATDGLERIEPHVHGTKSRTQTRHQFALSGRKTHSTISSATTTTHVGRLMQTVEHT